MVDSTAAISRVPKFLKWGHLRRGRQPPDIDVLSLISKCYNKLGKRVRIRRVINAHQDSAEETVIAKLSVPAQLNIKADHLATEYRLHGRKRSSANLDHHPGQGISFSILGQRIPSQYDNPIRFHVNGYHLRQYLQERHGWTDKVWQEVDFPRFSQHLKRHPLTKSISHLTFVHDQQ